MTVPSTAAATGTSTGRRVGFVVVTGLLTVLAAAFVVVVLMNALSLERTVHRVHDLAGAIILGMLAAGLLGTVLTRGRAVGALQQVLVVLAVFLAVDLVTGRVSPALFLFAALAPVVALHPRRGALLRWGRPSPLVAAGALLGGIPLVWYAAAQISLQRGAPAGEPHAYPEGHYAGMATMALAFVVVALLASLRGDGWRVPAWTAGVGVALFGVASIATPLLLGAVPPPYGILAVFGGAAFVALAELEGRAGGAKPSSSDDEATSTAPAL